MGRGSANNDDFLTEPDVLAMAASGKPVGKASLLEAAINSAAVPIFIIDDDRRYVEANQKACEILGVSRERLLGMRIDDIAASESTSNFADVFDNLIKQGSVSDQEFRIKTPSGKTLQVVFTAKANIAPGLHLSTWTSVEEEKTDASIPKSQQLSERERSVMQLIADGHNYKSIAEKLYLSSETVRAYSRSARIKLGARSREHAVVLALKNGQISSR